VESVVIRVVPARPEPLSPEEETALRSLTNAAFQQRRKQFQSILRKNPAWGLSHHEIHALEDLTGFDLTRRPETFGPGDFIKLSEALRAHFWGWYSPSPIPRCPALGGSLGWGTPGSAAWL
jgi:16S rRNA A1518/A1519 N6-dimethyltransferase RsmA/KsgA/DIM1 with predicted DNA glycosylase/AP lyase activity